LTTCRDAADRPMRADLCVCSSSFGAGGIQFLSAVALWLALTKWRRLRRWV